MKCNLTKKARLSRGGACLLCLALVPLLPVDSGWRVLGLFAAGVLGLGAITGFSLGRHVLGIYPRPLQEQPRPILTGALAPQFPAGTARRRK